ncbi:UPF0149 family protein [Mesorhizobium sp. M1338]|uniref:UPF0149 family protein n=1 Tax=Mesorhizobium sp. M1338 TaxID=2957085 RepID=UPI003338DD1F
MSAIDDMALPDAALEAWIAAKTNRRPLVRTMSALDGFVTAAVTRPRFADPQDWMCPLTGLPRDVLAKRSATDHAVFASVARIHNRINERSSTDRGNMRPASPPSPAAASTRGRGARASTQP